MCAVLGYYSPTPDASDADTLISLLMASKIRGLHSFGIAYYAPNGTLQSTKSLELAHILTALDSLRSELPKRLIAHCRYSTSGDYHDHNSNQPLVVSGIALAFNGVLHMGTKVEMELACGESMQTDNDGELFIKHLHSTGDSTTFLRSTKGSFAGCWLHDGKLNAQRNSRRPLWLARQGQATFIASTADIILRAFGSQAEPVNIEPYQLISA